MEPRLALVNGSGTRAEDDIQLACALMAGDPQVAEAVWLRYGALVRRLLRRALGPARDIDDVMQDVFLKLFDRVRTLRKPESLRSFIISLTTNVVRDELKYRWVRRIVRLSRDGSVPEPPAPGADAEARQALLRFYRILDRLRPDDRMAFVLRFIEGMELAEVAEAVGCSLATVKRRLAVIHGRVFTLVERDPALVDYVTGLSPEAFHGQ